MSKVKYYTLDKILEYNADYNIIYGERSNGKTTAVLGYALKRYIESGFTEQLGIIRRWEEDYKGKNGTQMFEAINALGWIEKWTKGFYNTIYYWGQRWYLAKYDEQGKKVYQDEKPFALGFSITSEEHYKSTAYPDITTILFDEFITRSYYIPDEFVKFQNLLSTIIRLRTNVKIFMCGNTINKYCPYFNEMGLINIKKQTIGTIDLYQYGESSLRVAVEYSDFNGSKKASNKYFAFDNPKLSMITHGGWEIDIYPHLPVKFKETEIAYRYFIKFNDEMLEAKIVYSKELNVPFTFIHRKTTPIKEDNTYLVYQEEIDVRKNYHRKITQPVNNKMKKVWSYFQKEKVFYQDNEVGEIMRNYLIWCKKEGI